MARADRGQRLLDSARRLQKVEEHQVREVLKCIIHTIIFNRALGHVSPRDTDMELINATYPDIGDDAVSARVDEGLRRIEQFLAGHDARHSLAASSLVRAATPAAHATSLVGPPSG